METGHHTLNDLFAQLGLGSDDTAIEDFLGRHHLQGEEKLARAEFWSDSQRKFLRDAIIEDSDWCEVVDELDALLRH
ncbi:DUF2789 domain-containing protein [Microbulbifer bruguierae]|uniref:DUF2789 domain-containing protein n=1 Tax=Microbulbifer bruguierae TaxID=3029061 RepID=A0ABY8NHY0_9GAMM|nr:DUF2789 domain-containing protein [Microbulbifer bruguierae]WGL18034.1 DUF2789 domain-containing protein [Microbulbifer bruguierae]